MLLTLSARSLAPLLDDEQEPFDLFSVPGFAFEEFDLHGLNLQTRFLTGWGLDGLDRLRDHADKAGCPWLTLIEEEPHQLASDKDADLDGSLDRMTRVLRVGHRLGCSSVAMAISAPDDESLVEPVADQLREIIARAEQLELNLLLSPRPGLTSSPERLTALIRKVGGFRIGSMPDFVAATEASDIQEYLRSLTPYASVVGAVTTKFNTKGDHTDFDLVACMEAIKSVGFEGTLSIEYRGEKDPVESIRRSVEIIRSTLEADE
jgi:sugar phosphate isomerase/epimerase